MTDNMGSLIIDLKATELLPEERDMLAHPLVGGVILFSRNYESRQQLKCLCQAIRSAHSAPLLITVDQEGGRVQRFLNEFTKLPPMAIFGKLYEKHPDQACHLTRHCGWLMAMELLSVGIDLSLAPVLDLQINKRVIGNRAFHAHPQVVIHLATALIEGMNEAGMAAIGKHFPGHGSVIWDSHVILPHDERALNELEQQDMLPFKHAIQNHIAAIMPAHIVFSNVDLLPVTYSHYWLQDILRNKLGFTGIILSDDLNMEGANILHHYEDRVIAAREAGCDFTLLCNNHPGILQVLDKVPNKLFFVKNNTWNRLQSQPITESIETNFRWQEANKMLSTVS